MSSVPSGPPPVPPRANRPPLPTRQDFMHKEQMVEQLKKVHRAAGYGEDITPTKMRNAASQEMESVPSNVRLSTRPPVTSASEREGIKDKKKMNFLGKIVNGFRNFNLREVLSGIKHSVTRSAIVKWITSQNTYEEDQNHLQSGTRLVAGLDNAVFRGSLDGRKREELMAQMDTFLKESKNSDNEDVKMMRGLVEILKHKLENAEIQPKDLVGCIKGPQHLVSFLERTAPQSLLIMTREKFIQGFNHAVDCACSEIGRDLSSEGLFRLAGSRTQQPEYLKACFSGQGEGISQKPNVEPHDWCDLLKALALQFELLKDAKVLTREDKAELKRAMAQLNDLLLDVEANSGTNKMHKNNLEIAAKEIIRMVRRFGFKDFEYREMGIEGFLKGVEGLQKAA